MRAHANHRSPKRSPRSARAFSLMEMMVALVITSLLLAATLTALDVSYKSYKVTSESASDQLVSRLVMHRILAMIRTGSEFGPYPADVLDASQNPAIYNQIEFLSFRDDAAGITQVTRIERRAAVSTDSDVNGQAARVFTQRGPFVLWMVIERDENGVTTTAEQPLLDGVLDASFTLEYLPGPRLRRATVDLTVRPRGEETIVIDEATGLPVVETEIDTAEGTITRTNQMIAAGLEAPVIRLISTTTPRQLDE
ncbi:MAG: prepilin-type N-terminal cleavage/methylation domain-containing protein [Phycisphaerales bacterium]|nr:prepilin-type N-terminal cleavage/methylation domain-containing protein [Phycisphaerales bacterium]